MSSRHPGNSCEKKKKRDGAALKWFSFRPPHLLHLLEVENYLLFFDWLDPFGVRSLSQSRLWHQGGCLCLSPVRWFRRCILFPYQELQWSRSPKGLEIVNYFLWTREPAALQLVRFAKNRGYRLFLKSLIERSWPWVTFISRVCQLRENHMAPWTFKTLPETLPPRQSKQSHQPTQEEMERNVSTWNFKTQFSLK